MTIKQYMNRLNTIRERMQELMDAISYWHHKAYGVRAIEYKADVIQVSASGDATEKAIDKYMALERELLAKADEFKQARAEVLQTIASVEKPQHRRILGMRYIAGYSFRDIAIVLRKPNGKRYTYDRVRAMHGEALKALEKNIEITQQIT